MQRRDYPAIAFGFAQGGIDKVHAVISQLALIDQEVLDAACAVLAQLAQQYFALAPELDQSGAHFGGPFITAQVSPLGRGLLFEAGAVNTFE